jgi:hypothetical protein
MSQGPTFVLVVDKDSKFEIHESELLILCRTAAILGGADVECS